MTELQLSQVYLDSYKTKSFELKDIAKELIEKARDKQTAYQLEFAAITIAAIGCLQSKFTQKVLELAELNYKLGGDFKELCIHILQAQESYHREKEQFFQQRIKKSKGIKIYPKKIFGIPLPYPDKIINEDNEPNPYAWYSELESEKSEENIIRLYAEMRATIYYYKRVLIKNNRLKGFGKATNKHKITIMNEILTTLQNHLPEITYFLGEGLAKGVFSAQGKDLWEKVKSWFASDKEKAVVATFEKEPQDIKQQGKLELLLEQKFEQLPEGDLLEFFELYLKAKGENPQITSYKSKIGDNNHNNIVIQGNGNNIIR